MRDQKQESSFDSPFQSKEESALFYENKVFAYTDQLSKQLVLDVGCGDGSQSLIILQRAPNITLFGVDNSKYQIQAASNRQNRKNIPKAKCEFKVMDGEKLQFIDSYFDIVTIMFVMGYCVCPKNILKQAHRVLKTNGRIIITEPLYHTNKIYPTCHYFEKYQEKCISYLSKHGDPDIGFKIFNLLHESNFQNVQNKIIDFHAGNRDPVKFRELLDFELRGWLSCAQVLLEQKVISIEELQLIESQKKQLVNKIDSSIMFCVIQLKGIKTN